MQASLEFALVLQRENIRDEFEQCFPKWAEAIIKYCKDTQVRSSILQKITADYTEDSASEGTLCEHSIVYFRLVFSLHIYNNSFHTNPSESGQEYT